MRNELLILLAILLLTLGIVLSQGPRKQHGKDVAESEAKTVTITVTTSSVWDRSKPLKEIDLSQQPYIRQGDITVYYFEPGQRRLAQEVARVLIVAWQLVAKKLNIALGDWKVALIALSELERAEIGGVYLKYNVQVKQPLRNLFQQLPKPPQPPFPVVVTRNLKGLKEADLNTRASIYNTMPHEALHNVVSKALDRGWRSDPRTRAFEDGLAEYIGHLVTKQLDPETDRWHLERRYRSVKDVLQGRERPMYDLTQEFLGHIELRLENQQSSGGPTPTEVAGYAVSLAFWLQIAQKHGDGVIKEFWQRLNQKGFPNAQEAARILSELTGEDIWTKLQNMDLHEVLQTLEQAAGD